MGSDHRGTEGAIWPSRSNEQIFYGKKGQPCTLKVHQMPYHMKKQSVL